MPLSMPATVKSQANVVLALLTTPPAAGSGIPTVTEVNAGKFIACHVYGDIPLFAPNQNTGDGPRKACTVTVPVQLGSVKTDAQEIQYSYSPQLLGTPGNAANLAYETLAPGTTLTAVQILGVDAKSSTVSAGQVANVFKITTGEYEPGRTGDGEFDEFSVKQKLILVNGTPIARNTVLA